MKELIKFINKALYLYDDYKISEFRGGRYELPLEFLGNKMFTSENATVAFDLTFDEQFDRMIKRGIALKQFPQETVSFKQQHYRIFAFECTLKNDHHEVFVLTDWWDEEEYSDRRPMTIYTHSLFNENEYNAIEIYNRHYLNDACCSPSVVVSEEYNETMAVLFRNLFYH